MRNWILRIAIVAVAAAGWQSSASAHLRDYLVNQDYWTAKRGEFEVEAYNDMHFDKTGDSGTYHSQHQLELEYGITDHIQLAYYEVYKWDRTDDWQRDAFKIEAKARFVEPGQWPLDVALYTEYENPNGTQESASDRIENKVILSKDLGRWNVVGNFVFERPINERSHWAYEYTAGVSYAVFGLTRLGLEVQQSLGDSKHFAFDGNHALYLVPGIYTSLGSHFRILVGPAFGMTRASEDFQLRSIVECEF